MSLSERITVHKGDLSRSDTRIADYLLRTHPQGLLQSVSKIAFQLDLDSSTVTRFFKKIGYESIREARAELRDHLPFVMDSPVRKYRQAEQGTDLSPTDKVVAHDLELVQSTFNNLPEGQLEAFADLILPDDRSVFVAGARKTHTLSFYLHSQLTLIRENVHLVRPDANYLPEALSDLKARDVVVAFDFRRYPKAVQKIAEYAKGINATVVAVSDSPMAPIRESASLFFVVSTQTSRVFDSYIGGMALIDAFLATYMNKAGKKIKEKIAKMEKISRHFDVYTWHD